MTTGGIAFTRGPLAPLLRNRFYIGEVLFKGEVLKGEQPAILDRALFEAVQAKLTRQRNAHRTKRSRSDALLAGRLFDERGNRMVPSHTRRRGIKYRYYLSACLLQGQAEQSGAVHRVPAADIESAVVKAVRQQFGSYAATVLDDRVLIATHVTRVVVRSDGLTIQLQSSQ